MIAVDTNILVYAHRLDSTSHAVAKRLMTELSEGGAWAIPWPCLHEFWSVVTNPRIFKHPATQAEALDQLEAWMASPTVLLMHETSMHWSALRRLMEAGPIVGAQIHDARIVAICLQHGVRELWSADRDFKRFPALKVRNPLLT